MRFRSWSCGHPGGLSDLNVFDASNDRHWINALSSKGVRNINGVPVPYFLVGDGIYTHRTCIQIPFPGHNLRTHEWQWNFWQSSSRMVVERAFGVLKGRWAILTGGPFGQIQSQDDEHVSDIATCCAILHNICIQRGDTLPRSHEVPHGWRSKWSSAEVVGPAIHGSSRLDLLHARDARNALNEHLHTEHEMDY